MNATDVIAFVFEADTHCYNCTEKRFGEPSDPVNPWYQVVDDEGNEVGAVFGDVDAPAGLYCGGCFITIKEPYDEEYL